MTWLLDNLQTVIAIILVFGLLIFIHEFGHFLLAKRAGILVREFAIGFGPKIYMFKRNETRFTIRLFPLGGYVRMAGEDPEVIEIRPGHRLRIITDPNGIVTHFLLDKNSLPDQGEEVIVEEIDYLHSLKLKADVDGEIRHFSIDPKAMIIQQGMETQIAPWDRQYGSKTVGQRFWTIFAGPLANILLAIVLFIVIAAINGVATEEPIVGEVVEGYPAYEAGLTTGDRVVAINGISIDNWDQMQSIINANPNEKLSFTVYREEFNQQFDTMLTPRSIVYISSILSDKQIDLVAGIEIAKINGTAVTSAEQANQLVQQNQGKTIEITIPTVEDGKTVERKYNVDLQTTTIDFDQIGKIGITAARSYAIGDILLEGPKETYRWTMLIFDGLKQLFTSSNPLNQVGGPVAIFKLTGDFADRGIMSLLFWAAVLSINLAIFNLLPVPALDGGRLLFIAIEAVRGKPIDPAKESLVHFIGFALLMLLIIIVTWNDIQRLFL